jgi:hypothetical protein
MWAAPSHRLGLDGIKGEKGESPLEKVGIFSPLSLSLSLFLLSLSLSLSLLPRYHDVSFSALLCQSHQDGQKPLKP